MVSPTKVELADPFIGRDIAGAYVIQELTGVGSMGRVYRAHQTMLERSVAVKILSPEQLGKRRFAERFYREARAASALNHPNSVGVIDFGSTDDGVLYLVMEYLRGTDVARMLSDQGPQPIDRACRILIDVLSALDEAHACGVVHRDLKPENLFIERMRSGRDLVKVLDFGIASLSGDGGETGKLNVLCGTPAYMAPEQIRMGEIDGRADLYAAGAVLYELLTGSVPYAGDSHVDVLSQHLDAPVPDPSRLRAGLPPALVEVVRRALAKDPARRFQSADEMRLALDAVLRAQEVRTSGAVMRSRSQLPERRHAEPRPLLGREVELGRLIALRRSAREDTVVVQLTGPVGAGKTRMLAEVAARAAGEGAIVVQAGPHDSMAPVAYWPLRLLLRGLWNRDDDELAVFAEGDLRERDPFAAAGLAVVLGEHGRSHSGRRSRVAEVTRALALAIRDRACAGGEMVLSVDDAHLADGSTLQVLSRLPSEIAGLPVLLCLSSSEGVDELDGAETVVLGPLDPREVRAYVDAEYPCADPAALLPLMVEQLAALGLEEGAALPEELAEVISLRVQRHRSSAQHLLQLAAVLGLRCSRAALERMAHESGLEGLTDLGELLCSGLLVERGEVISFAHPRVRELIEASIPVTTRGVLHARALADATRERAPIEVRAWHAWKSGEVLAACALLEQVGTLAERRGDHVIAQAAFQHGWERVRAESSLHADETLRAGLASMARGLSAALSARGQLAEAEGVLFEQRELTAPESVERARTLAEMARIAARRGRPADAVAQAMFVLQIAGSTAARECEATAHKVIADVRRSGGNERTELDALQNAYAALSRTSEYSHERAELTLELGAAMRRKGDLAGVGIALLHVKREAAQAGAFDVSGRALLELARVELERSNRIAATQNLNEAHEHAVRAGDLDLARRVEAARVA